MTPQELFESFPSEESLIDMIRHTSATVWENSLVEKDIENWLGNFKGEVHDIKHERLVALLLLTHFTFYNKNEVRHLCKVIYRDLVHKIVEGIDAHAVDVEDVVRNFFSKSNIISSERLSGSGGFIAYYFRQENQLPMTLFNFSIDNVEESIENIIVIDDVTLSEGEAGQMYEFWQTVRKNYPNKKYYLLTLMASEASLLRLREEFNIVVLSAIHLDSRDKCFHEESDVFSSFEDASIKERLIAVAREIAAHYGRKIDIPGVAPLGYANGQYAFGFFYNTPDNSLPIFWGRINGWIPIVRRYHKNYNSQSYLHDERYI